ncbi:MAG: hypothetical protein ACPLRM_05700, partial [Anaerolineae bacterium]
MMQFTQKFGITHVREVGVGRLRRRSRSFNCQGGGLKGFSQILNDFFNTLLNNEIGLSTPGPALPPNPAPSARPGGW